MEFVAGEPDLAGLRAGLAFNEIMYNPLGQAGVSAGEFEFLELKNIGESTLDLSGLFFSSGISFIFPEGSMLASGELFLLGINRAALQSRYPGLVVNGIFEGKLANEGEAITLSAGIGAPVLSVAYDDAAPWPEQADGQGFSLAADRESELGFRVSVIPGGSPGSDNSGLAKPADDLVLTMTRLANGMLRVSFTGVQGWSYSLETSPSLHQAWQPLSNFFPGTSGKVSRTISPRVSRERFFRLVTPANP